MFTKIIFAILNIHSPMRKITSKEFYLNIIIKGIQKYFKYLFTQQKLVLAILLLGENTEIELVYNTYRYIPTNQKKIMLLKFFD